MRENDIAQQHQRLYRLSLNCIVLWPFDISSIIKETFKTPVLLLITYDVFNFFNLSGWLIMTLREVVKIYIFQRGTKRHELE